MNFQDRYISELDHVSISHLKIDNVTVGDSVLKLEKLARVKVHCIKLHSIQYLLIGPRDSNLSPLIHFQTLPCKATLSTIPSYLTEGLKLESPDLFSNAAV